MKTSRHTQSILKLTLCIVSLLLPSVAHSQLLNGSFETGFGPDLSNWEWTCGAQSENIAPPNGGNFCIKVSGGNLQGCFPGYAYQKLPSIINGQTFEVSCEALAQISQPIGIYLGTINNGQITPLAGDTTSATSWTTLSVTSSFSIPPGDTAVVLLWGGITTGPNLCYGYFDMVNLTPSTGIDETSSNQEFTVYPTLFTDYLTITDETPKENSYSLYDIQSKVVQKGVFFNSVKLSTTNLTNGVYIYEVINDSGKSFRGKVIKY